MARQRVDSFTSPSTPATNERSILRMSTGKRRRYSREE